MPTLDVANGTTLYLSVIETITNCKVCWLLTTRSSVLISFVAGWWVLLWNRDHHGRVCLKMSTYACDLGLPWNWKSRSLCTLSIVDVDIATGDMTAHPTHVQAVLFIPVPAR